jgi:hypothetical protein
MIEGNGPDRGGWGRRDAAGTVRDSFLRRDRATRSRVCLRLRSHSIHGRSQERLSSNSTSALVLQAPVAGDCSFQFGRAQGPAGDTTESSGGAVDGVSFPR